MTSPISTCIQFLSVNGDNDLVVAAREELAGIKDTNAMMTGQIIQLREENQRLKLANAKAGECLKLLYEETADYIRINHLGDVHHNVSMQRARDALKGLEGT